MAVPDDEEVLEGEEVMKKDEKKCEGDDCETKAKEGAEPQNDLVDEINEKLKKK